MSAEYLEAKYEGVPCAVSKPNCASDLELADKWHFLTLPECQAGHLDRTSILRLLKGLWKYYL